MGSLKKINCFSFVFFFKVIVSMQILALEKLLLILSLLQFIKFPVVLDLSVIIRSYQEFAKESIDIVSKLIMELMSPFACGCTGNIEDSDVWCNSYYFKCVPWPSYLLT